MSLTIPHPSTLKIKDFNYDLPEEKIARYPLAQRDASKILIYKEGIIETDIYKNIDRHLPEEALITFNQTKVIHARLFFEKPSGGRIEIFCLEPDERYHDVISAMQQTHEVYWKCMVGGAAKWKPGQVLELKTEAGDTGSPGKLALWASLEERRGPVFIIKLNWKYSTNHHSKSVTVSFSEVLQIAGALPIPPYLNRAAEASDEVRYQTIFAKEEGSVAAPTAALHFTPEVLTRLAQKNITAAFLTLHVGAGTFKPVKSERMQGHDMHAEWIEVSKAFVKQLLTFKKSRKPVVAVGTTSARTLESLYWIGVRLLRNEWNEKEAFAVTQWYPYDHPSEVVVEDALAAVLKFMEDHNHLKLITRTQIIIAPGYDFKMIDGLITNFHQPQSTLLLLVAALIGPDWRKVYDYALSHDFRFLSYGDGCLLWKAKLH